MPKPIRGGEHRYGNGSVVGHVNENTGGYGICFGSHYGQDDADQEDHVYRSPGEHQLGAVQEGETERGHENGNWQTEAASEHGIEKAAKEKLFHERREGNAENAQRPGFGGRAKKAIDWQLFRDG